MIRRYKTDIQREHFNKISEAYIKGRSTTTHLEYKRIWWNFIGKELKNQLPKNAEILVLDSMCGNAEFSVELTKKIENVKVDAFDYSEEMVREARRKLKKYSRKIKVFRADALKYENKNKYDLVIIIGGLHHVPFGVKTVLKRVYNSLKKGGLFLNLEPTHNNIIWQKSREKIYKENPLFEESTEEAFTLEEYNKLLTKTGFNITYQIHPGLLGYVLHYNPDAFPSINIGTPFTARILAKIDLFLGKTFIGEYFSFATWTIAKKHV